jgi:hypothetical protein
MDVLQRSLRERKDARPAKAVAKQTQRKVKTKIA